MFGHIFGQIFGQMFELFGQIFVQFRGQLQGQFWGHFCDQFLVQFIRQFSGMYCHQGHPLRRLWDWKTTERLFTLVKAINESGLLSPKSCFIFKPVHAIVLLISRAIFNYGLSGSKSTQILCMQVVKIAIAYISAPFEIDHLFT